ncbi:MAG: RNA polymerase sigma factor [Myxococcota bacterium]|nr:RNA polymerase sigma factor [Myxococcota bacterium]
MAKKLTCASSEQPLDSALVARIQGGDKEAFYTLYHRYAGYIASVAYRILGSGSDVDDVVQETFLTAMRKINQIKTPEHVKLWLATIAVRHAQRCGRRIRKNDDYEVERLQGDGASAKPESAAELFLIRSVLSGLPEKLLTPWVLVRIEGMTLEEVACATHCALATIKRRVVKAETSIRRKTNDR